MEGRVTGFAPTSRTDQSQAIMVRARGAEGGETHGIYSSELRRDAARLREMATAHTTLRFGISLSSVVCVVVPPKSVRPFRLDRSGRRSRTSRQ